MNSGTHFLLGQSQDPDWRQAAGQCLEQIKATRALLSAALNGTLNEAEFRTDANFGFVYATDIHAEQLQSIVAQLRDASGVRHWVGTVGVAICATGREYYESPALAVMIGALPADSFRQPYRGAPR